MVAWDYQSDHTLTTYYLLVFAWAASTWRISDSDSMSSASAVALKSLVVVSENLTASAVA